MNANTATKNGMNEKRAYTVDEICGVLGIGKTSAYALVREGHFKVVRIGNAIRISRNSFDEWLDRVETGR